jgi:hypothetical protein
MLTKQATPRSCSGPRLATRSRAIARLDHATDASQLVVFQVWGV